MKKLSFELAGMHCAACAAAIERTVKKLPGASAVYVNFAAARLTLEADPARLSAETVVAAVKKAGFEATPSGEAQKGGPAKEEFEARRETRRFAIAAAFAALLTYVAMHTMLGLPFFDLAPRWNALLQGILLLPVAVAGFRFYTDGFRALFRGAPNMDSLIASGTGAAIVYSLWLCAKGEFDHLYFDTAGMIVALIMLGKYLEGRSRRRASGAIRELMRLAPDTAIRIENGAEREIPAAQVKPGDLLRLKPGARIPTDGVAVEGVTSVDESMLSGESMPVDKSPGDPLTGGSINRNGSIVMKATRTGEETTLARIIKLVEDAQGSRPPIARLADVISGYFVWTVLAVAAVTLAGWLLAGAAFAGALEFALAVLVIACPCALGLATPIAVIAGIGRGARSGILIKSGAVLETAGKIDAVVFDKTGTLTLGKPEVNAIVPAPPFSENELLAATAAAEKHSSHPLAEAIVRAAERREIEVPLAERFEDRPGYGVSAVIGGKPWLFGNAKLLAAEGIAAESFQALSVPEGLSLIYAVRDGVPAGIIGIGDRLKPDAAEAIEAINALGVETVMLTGDNLPAARAMADKLKLASLRAELLPGDKSGIIRELQGGRTPRIIAMVGDGINDAPALAQADVGIAIGSGADAAMESADVVLMRDDLTAVAAAIKLSRATMRIIRQNLFWAFFYNAVGIPLAAGVFYTLLHWKLSPVLGAAAMAASSVTVVLNALRLRRVRL